MKIVILLLGFFCCFSAMGQTPIPTDTYMSFPLDGNATDIGGSNYSGTIVGGVTATTDRFGNASKAMQFNGTTGYIDIPYATSVGTLDFSISYWANPAATNSGFVFTKEQSVVAPNQFRMGSTGAYFGCFSDITNTYGGGLAYVPTTGVWSFYTIIRQGASIKLYVNGVYKSALNTAGTINHSNALNYRIGSMYSGTTFFNGKIDDLRMFKHALSAGEIAALYAYGKPPVITSFTPVSGTIGTSVTITGTGFSATPAENIVYFGAVRATVSVSTSTSITITVPPGTGSIVPVSVMVNGAVAYSTSSSTPTFNITNSPNIDLIYSKTDVNSVGLYPTSIAISDFNGDGKADLAEVYLYFSDFYNLGVMLGDGIGGFGEVVLYQIGDTPHAVKTADFNGDGIVDIATANWGSNSVSVLLGNGNGTFATATSFSVETGPGSIAVGDFNGDGKADLAAANDQSNSVSVLLGNGSGGFASTTPFLVGTQPLSMAIGDFNGDGKADLATANFGSNTVSVLIGDGSGGFATAVPFLLGISPNSIAVGDFNGDGKPDLAIGGSNDVTVLLGLGDGNFATANSFFVGNKPISIAIGDFNGDGKTDIATTIYYSNNVSVLIGDGLGGFATAVNFGAGNQPSSIAVGDFNRDGKADMASTNLSSNTVSIFLNASIGITTQAITEISSSTATGNGNIFDLGPVNPTAYGVCWNTTGTPTTSDSKVDNGTASSMGPFTALMTGLTSNTTYYVRAYATNTGGTTYGNEVSFTTRCITTWTGTTSTDWNTAANWLLNQTPITIDDIIIPSGVPNWPTYTGNFAVGNQCRNLIIQSGAQITITGNLNINSGSTISNNGNIRVGGSWVNQGIYMPGAGNVEFIGEGTSSITPNPTNNLGYLINDDFISFPGNWLGDTGTGSGKFGQNSTSYAGGSSPEVWFRYTSGVSTKRMYQVVNTTGKSVLTLQFRHMLNDYKGNGYTILVEYSTDGINWNSSGWSISPTTYVPASLVNIYLTSAQGVGSATYYISFTVTGNLNNISYWHIDNVKLFYQDETFFNLIVNKANALTSINSGLINVGRSITLKPGSSLTNLTGSTINIGNTMTLESDATGAASYIDNGTTNINSGAIVQRYLTASKWHLISAPVSGQSIPALVGTNPFATNGVKYGLAPFNNSLVTPNWVHYTTSTLAGAGSFTVGKGYEAMLTAPTSLAFAGTLVNTNQSVAVTAGTNNWNLIGNPFPSSLYANNPASATNNIIDANSSIFKPGFVALYVWDPETSLFRTINNASAASYIQSGQGFFINVASGGTASLTAAMRTHSSAPFYKGTESEWPGFDLIAAISETNSMAQILFVPGTTVGLDEGYDAGMYSAGKTEKAIYTHIEGSKVDFGLQCLPENTFDKNIIPVGLNAPEGSSVFFTANTHNFPANIMVYLEDRNEGKFTRLDESGSLYAIKLTSASSGIGRFYLHTSTNLLTGNNDLQDANLTVIPLPKENKIRIIGKVGASSVAKIYTISGQLLGSTNITNSSDNEISFSPKANGVYLLKIQSGGTVVTRKVIWVE